MEEKKTWSDYLALAIKIISGFVLYFSVAILITAADKVIAADKIGLGYTILIAGAVFLFVQFFVTLKVVNELFNTKNFKWMPMLLKTFAGLSFYFSLAILVGFSETIISPATATLGYTLTLMGVLLFAAQFILMAYGIGELMQKRTAQENDLTK